MNKYRDDGRNHRSEWATYVCHHIDMLYGLDANRSPYWDDVKKVIYDIKKNRAYAILYMRSNKSMITDICELVIADKL